MKRSLRTGIFIFAGFLLFTTACTPAKKEDNNQSEEPNPGFRSTAPLQVDTPTFTVEEHSLEDSVTFMITPKKNGIRLNFHNNGIRIDTLVKNTDGLRSFIRSHALRTLRPYTILKTSKTQLKASEKIIDVLRENGLNKLNFVTEL